MRSQVSSARIVVVVAGVASGYVFAPCGRAQSAGPVAFEVASIKPSQPGSTGGSMQLLRGGRLVARNATLDWMIRTAYHIHNYQIAGGPHWIYNDHYDIEAIPPSGATDEEARLMLRSLLAQRFKLRVHMAEQERPIYELVIAKEGQKLRVAKMQQPCALRSSDGHVDGMSCPMTRLAEFLSGELERTVLDMTGLGGTFDFALDWLTESVTPEPSVDGPVVSNVPQASTIFAALRHQLGVRLKPQRGLVEILTIEHVELPTAN